MRVLLSVIMLASCGKDYKPSDKGNQAYTENISPELKSLQLACEGDTSCEKDSTNCMINNENDYDFCLEYLGLGENRRRIAL